TWARQRSGRELANPRPAEVHELAHLVGRAGLAPVETEAQAQDPPLPLVEDREELLDLGREQGAGGGVERRLGATVLDEIPQLRLAVPPDGLRQGYRGGPH